jgi:hypothetical protein
MNKAMNTKKKRTITEKSKRNPCGEGSALGAGSPPEIAKLQNALERCADRELALTLEVYDLKLRLKDAMTCCRTFFHVAGKCAEDGWLQFEKAAILYQRLLEKEERP